MPRRAAPPSSAAPGRRPDPYASQLPLAVLLLLGALLAATASTIDVVRDAYGIKGDEATYVAMAYSVAYDGDLRFDRGDLERFTALYGRGPEGIFLKQPVTLSARWVATPPFIALERTAVPDAEALYYGKAFLHALVAAPFVWLAGLNGLLLLNVVLLTGLAIGFYRYARLRMPDSVALFLSLGFLGGSIVPLYLVWLTPEILNVALVGLAYALWLRRDPHDGDTPWRQPTTLVAVALLGLAVYSKFSHGLLVAPIVGVALWRRQFRTAAVQTGVWTGVIVLCFALTAIGSGDFNYQGGERKTFYGVFPFEDGEHGFDRLGIDRRTDSLPIEMSHLALNVPYFFAGRHFGFVPYFFPGALVVGLAVWRRRELDLRHGLIGAAVAASAVVLLVMLPHTWSGGGGPPGNRYFLSLYPALFFLVPPLTTPIPALVVWTGLVLFTGPIVTDPFVSASRPWQKVEHGPLRALPVELTLVNDLPIQLNQGRSRIPYGDAPPLLLYYLDENAYREEPVGIWVRGERRTDVIVRTGTPLSAVTVTLTSPVPNDVVLRVDGERRRVGIVPGQPTTVHVPVRGVIVGGAQSFLVSVRTGDGFIPAMRDPGSTDRRFLGVAMRLQGTADGE